MGSIYEILNHITGDNLFTHVLPRAARFAAPLILEDHPELKPAGACLDSLDRWLASDRTPDKSEGIKMWLAELRMTFPDIKPEYEIASYADAWLSMNPLDELAAMVGPEKIVVVEKS